MKKNDIYFALLPVILISFYLPLDRPFFTNYSFETGIDNWIPLLTIFTVPYVSYYFFLIFSFFYFLKAKSSKILRHITLSMTVAILLAYLFYILFQNSVQRPEVESKTLFDDLYLFINRHVPPYNAFPSLHVAISAIIAYGFYLLKVRFNKVIIVWASLIIISTVLTKQHYFLDILGGVLLAILSLKLVTALNKKR